MNPLRSPKSTYVAAFLLGGLIALLLARPGRGAEAFRLDRLAIVRFSPTPDGRLLLQNGVLDLAGDVAWRGTQNIARPPGVPEWVLNRNLVNVQAWAAFHNLGGNATGNFEIRAGGVHVPIGDQVYMAVGVAPDARTATGSVINISTRTRLHGSGDVVMAGFVIEDRPRTVLVRAVGPSLVRFGVASPHPDPWLAIKRGTETIAGNDDWSNQQNAAQISRAAARVGAFPLDPAAFDAAQLVTLPPGGYTVHVSTDRVDVRDRDVLIEVYAVPEDMFD
ncbi:MAG TPA: hypothetical protein VM029_16425 [Opitutaceae bacterium]|nr:hypothetical protein [Opitutaceae bacterium]